MRKQGAFKKLLMILSLLAFLGTGYLTVSLVTSNDAEAFCPSGRCISPVAGLAPAIPLIFSSVISPALDDAQAQISAYFNVAINNFTTTVDNDITTITAKYSPWFDTFWYYNLLPAMQSMTDQLNTMNADQARALASFTDAANLNRVKKEYEEQEINSHREQRPGENVCVAGTIAGGMTRAATFQRAYNAAAPVDKVGRSGNTVGTPASAGKAADIKERWNEYTSRYCRKDDNNGSSGCAADQSFAGQDIDVAGTVFTKETIDLRDADTKTTVDDLITNIAEPFVKDTVPPGAVDSHGGQAAILAGESYKAKRQVIYDSLYHVIARRAPGSSMQSFVQPMRAAAGIDPALISDNPSHNEIMQVMMSERFNDGKYALSQVDEPENNQREMVIQQAFQLMQMSDQMDLMDRYALVLAAQVSEEVKKAKGSSSGAEGASLK